MKMNSKDKYEERMDIIAQNGNDGLHYILDKPPQYKKGIDTFQRAESNLTKEEIIAICKFNIDKYTWRDKNQDKEDFIKIIDYANFALKQLNK